MEQQFELFKREIVREKNTQPSKTVPDQSLTIKQIMERHTRGLPLEGKIPQYHTEEELENETGRDPRSMDISEIHDELEQIAGRMEERKAAKTAADIAKRKQDQQEYENNLKAQWLKEQQENPAKGL